MEVLGIPIDNTVATCSNTVLFLQLFGGTCVVTIFPIWLSVCMIHGIVSRMKSWSRRSSRVNQVKGGE